jgi:cardiolipin synthase A/B
VGIGVSAVWNLVVSLWQIVPPWVWLGALVAYLVVAVGWLLMQRRPPVTTLAWIIAFISLPVLGAAAYFFFGPRKLGRRRMRRSLARQRAARFAPDQAAPMPTTLADRAWLTSLARLALVNGDAPARPTKTLTLFTGGDETYDAIAKAIAGAQSQVHMEYYIFEPDAIGERLRDVMIERARAGVQVRVLVDALGSSNAKPAFWRPLIEAGGQVRQFNPPKLLKLKPGKLNFRTHRKIVVIDGRHAFTGGINVSAGNSWFSSGGTAWRDTHLEFEGAPAQDLQVVFLEDWLYAGMDDPHARDFDETNLKDLDWHIEEWFPEQPVAAGPWVQIIDSGPDEASPDIHRYYFTAIASARRRCWITTPYFVPDEPIVMALVTAAARGVDVRIILPAQGDSKLVTAAASTFANEVAAQGVQVFEYQGRMIHAKTMVVDDELAVVGTANLDNRSFRLNFEVIAAIYDRDVTAQLAAMFSEDLLKSQAIDPHRLEGRFWLSLQANVARLFAPLL